MTTIKTVSYGATCLMLSGVLLFIAPAQAQDSSARSRGTMTVKFRACPAELEQAKALREGQAAAGTFFCGKSMKAVPAGPWSCREEENETSQDDDWEDPVTGECEISEIMACTRSYICAAGRKTSGSRKPARKSGRRRKVSAVPACSDLAEKLEKCEPFTCSFAHPFTGGKMTKRILGIRNGVCVYTEEMPDGGEMRCRYNEKLRKAVASYLRKEASAGSAGTSVSLDVRGKGKEVKQTLDGKEATDPRQTALDNGDCEISGYDRN